MIAFWIFTLCAVVVFGIVCFCVWTNEMCKLLKNMPTDKNK